MRVARSISALLVVSSMASMQPQTTMNGPLITPAARLTHLDKTSAQVVYHDRNDKTIVLNFVITDTTIKAVVKENDTVFISYIDRDSKHVAQLIALYLPSHNGGSTGKVGGIAKNQFIPLPSDGRTDEIVSSSFNTLYSQEGAEAIRRELAQFIRIRVERSGLHNIAGSAALKADGYVLTAADSGCVASNVWESSDFYYDCKSNSNGSVSPTLATWSIKSVTLHSGDSVIIRDVFVEPEGLKLALDYGPTHPGYASTLKIPYVAGWLPPTDYYQNRLLEIFEFPSDKAIDPNPTQAPSTPTQPQH